MRQEDGQPREETWVDISADTVPDRPTKWQDARRPRKEEGFSITARQTPPSPTNWPQRQPRGKMPGGRESCATAEEQKPYAPGRDGIQAYSRRWQWRRQTSARPGWFVYSLIDTLHRNHINIYVV